MPDKNTVYYVWVVGSYKGEQAKSVLAHAHAGSGSYQILENRGNKLNPDVVAAFRYVPDPNNGIPEHLIEVVDPLKIKKFEETYHSRSGTPERAIRKAASDKKIEQVRAIFDDRRIAAKQ